MDAFVRHYLQRLECVCTEPVSPLHPELARTSLHKSQACIPKSQMLLLQQIPKHKANWGCWHIVCLFFPYGFISIRQMKGYAEILYFRIGATKEVEMYHLSLLHCTHNTMNNNSLYFRKHAIQCKKKCFFWDALWRFVISIQHHWGLRAFTSSLTHIHYSEMVQQSQSCMGRARQLAKIIRKSWADEDILTF